MLIEELSPPVDPNWDPIIREPQVTTPSEKETQWLPREPPMPPAWVAPDERPPMQWQRSPAGGNRRHHHRDRSAAESKMAIASMVIGLLGLVLRLFGSVAGNRGGDSRLDGAVANQKEPVHDERKTDGDHRRRNRQYDNRLLLACSFFGSYWQGSLGTCDRQITLSTCQSFPTLSNRPKPSSREWA